MDGNGFDARDVLAPATESVRALLGLAANLDVDLDRLDDTDITAALVAVEAFRLQLTALEHRLGAQVMSRHIGAVSTDNDLAGMLRSLLRLSRPEARLRAEQTVDLGPRTTLTGEPLPPILPACADALTAGEISRQHVQIISRALDNLIDEPVAADGTIMSKVDVAEAVEALLVDQARQLSPEQLQRTAQRVVDRFDPNGSEPCDDQLDSARGLHLRHHRGGRHDGMAELRAYLTPENAALWETILDALSAPAPADDGTPDPRSPEQRRHDGLLDAGLRLLRAKSLPDTGGTPVTVLIRTTADELPDLTDECAADSADGNVGNSGVGNSGGNSDGNSYGARHGRWGFGITEHGQLIRFNRLARIGLAEADLITALVDTQGAVLNLGRAQRLASCAQRRALAVRDGGCCFPGCDRPASWCQVHHVREWIKDGPTDIDNLVMLCGHHHRTFARAGWTLRMHDGVPEWLPPAWLDPLRRPRRNTANHLLDIEFRQPALA